MRTVKGNKGSRTENMGHNNIEKDENLVDWLHVLYIKNFFVESIIMRRICTQCVNFEP